VLELDLGAEPQVFVVQTFELAGIFDGDGSEAGDSGKQL